MTVLFATLFFLFPRNQHLLSRAMLNFTSTNSTPQSCTKRRIWYHAFNYRCVVKKSRRSISTYKYTDSLLLQLTINLAVFLSMYCNITYIFVYFLFFNLQYLRYIKFDKFNLIIYKLPICSALLWKIFPVIIGNNNW